MKYIFYCLLILIPVKTSSQGCQSQTKTALSIISELGKKDNSYIQIKTDSLASAIDSSCSKTFLLINQLSGSLQLENGNTKEAQIHFSKALEIAKENNFKIEQKTLYRLMSQVYEFNDNYEEAMKVVSIALNIRCSPKSVMCVKEEVKSLISKAEILRNLGEIEKSIFHLDEAIEQMEQGIYSDSLQRLTISKVMGVIYQEELHDFESALESFLEGLNYAPHGHNSKFIMQNNVGNAYVMMQKVDKAVNYYRKTLDATSDPRYTYRPLVGLGDIYMFMKHNYAKGLEYYSAAYKEAVKTGEDHTINNCLAQIGKAHYFSGEYSKAIKYLNESLNYYKKDSVSKITKVTVLTKKLLLLSEIALVDEGLSLETRQFFTELDTLANRERAIEHDKSLERLKHKIMKDSLQLQDLGFQKKELELKSRNRGLVIVIFCLLGFLAGISLLYRKYKTRTAELEKLNVGLQNLIANNSSSFINTRIEISGAGKNFFVPVEEIIYIEAYQNGSKFHKIDKTSSWTEEPIKNTLEKLPVSFMRINRQSIINIYQIDWVNSSSLKMKNGLELKIGRPYRNDLFNRLRQ